MLDAAIKYMAANLAKQVSSDKLTGIKEALLKAQDSRIVSQHCFQCHSLVFLFNLCVIEI